MNLTPIERKCLELRAKGLIAKEIAREVHCSYRTIETHFKNINTKNKTRGTYESLAIFVREETLKEVRGA